VLKLEPSPSLVSLTVSLSDFDETGKYKQKQVCVKATYTTTNDARKKFKEGIWNTPIQSTLFDSCYDNVKVKQSRYTPWRRLGGEEI
jgi:hypothetical protein